MTARQAAGLRPMRESDLAPAARLSLAAFGAAADDGFTVKVWGRRIGHCLATDPAGAFVAEQDGRLVGAVAAIRREGTWILSLLTVDPVMQGGGVGRALLSASLDYAAPGDAGLIISSNDSVRWAPTAAPASS